MKIDLRLGDTFELIKDLEDNSVDLVITSPPYSDIVNYGKNVSTKNPNDYVDWILPLFKEIYRVLKPSGSFILNINDKCENGYRSTYIYDLISRNNKETKLKLYDTYIWHKKNGIPNGALKRFRNTTEFLFHFCKDNKSMKFYMDRVLREHKDSSNDRYKYEMSERQGNVVDGKRIRIQKVRAGGMKTDENGVQIPHLFNRRLPDKVRPDNVFDFSTAAASRDNTIKHPAPYHKELPLYFINLLTDEGDVVLDTFSGIATTGVACKELNRDYIGFELNQNYHEFSQKRLSGIEEEQYVVNQYDLENNFICSFSSASAASIQLNLPIHNIMMCFRTDTRNTCGGFIWKLEKKHKNVEPMEYGKV
jgi:site-specific DNA-methyltransferase (adenine-specific)/site-specific DNA-methyltransferase (cytosine-N4-specific)